MQALSCRMLFTHGVACSAIQLLRMIGSRRQNASRLMRCLTAEVSPVGSAHNNDVDLDEPAKLGAGIATRYITNNIGMMPTAR